MFNKTLTVAKFVLNAAITAAAIVVVVDAATETAKFAANQLTKN